MKTATIAHISADYPDDICSSKTNAISGLLALTGADFDHIVYSLNRAKPALSEALAAIARAPFAPEFAIVSAGGNALTSVRYSAPGKGLFLRSTLERLADWISNDMVRRGLEPDLVHGHKLTMEGVIARAVAARLDVPFAITIQGNTDQKIISYRPDLWRDFKKVFHESAISFAFSPWALDYVQCRFGTRAGQTTVLPVVTEADRILAPRLVGPKLVSAFHLSSYRLKNATALIKATAALERDFSDFALSIIGDGPATIRRLLEKKIKGAGAKSVRLEGPVPHAEIQRRFNQAGGFIMPSHRESFGMVFIEALLAGCPIVYPKGRAVDGYFGGCSFAIGVDPKDDGEIREAMRRLLNEERSLKADLAVWQSSGAPRRFQRDSISAAYSEGLRSIISCRQ